MLQGFGSKWAIEWEVPLDIDLKVDYRMKGKLTGAETEGSVSVAMRSLVVKGEMWLFLQPHPLPDGVKSIVVHFEDEPEIAFHLAGEARNSSATGATVGRAIAFAAKQIYGTDAWDLATKFVKERVDKEIALLSGGHSSQYAWPLHVCMCVSVCVCVVSVVLVSVCVSMIVVSFCVHLRVYVLHQHRLEQVAVQ